MQREGAWVTQPLGTATCCNRSPKLGADPPVVHHPQRCTHAFIKSAQVLTKHHGYNSWVPMQWGAYALLGDLSHEVVQWRPLHLEGDVVPGRHTLAVSVGEEDSAAGGSLGPLLKCF